MIRICLLTACLLLTCGSFAQQVSVKDDTVFSGNTPYALFKTQMQRTVHYSFCALSGKELIEVHNSYTTINAKQAYVVTFLNDHKQGMVVKNVPFPASIIKDIADNALIEKGATVNTQAENRFLKLHPLPQGYTDIDQLIEY